jgi:cation diffusion facilitator CzcD-associated flavoprotein CzcO
VIQDRCNFLINGGGILNNWKWPSIPGLHSFKGKLVHSANWPKDFIYTDLTVAVIGNGSTGIQIVPAIQPDVKQLIHLIRSPTWVTPGAVSRFPSLKGKMPEHFSEEQKQLWRENPGQYMEFRKAVELEINGKFKMLLNGAEAAETAKKNARESMLSQLGSQDSDFVQKLIPDFPIGCRRITPGVGYLESFLKPNVRVIIDATIERVDEEGLIMSNGEHIKLDALICATGFDVSFNPRFPITGRGGISLQDVWGEPNIPEAYLSMCIPKFPNYFGKMFFHLAINIHK